MSENRKFNGEKRNSKFDRNNGKGYRKQSDTKKKFITLQIPLGVSKDNTELAPAVSNLVSKIPFDIISISTTIKRSLVQKDGTGFMQVGYINGFNDDAFKVAVSENVVDLVNTGCFAVMPRFKCYKDGNPTYILGFSLVKCEEFNASKAAESCNECGTV